MIGWALRWVLVWVGIAVAVAALVDNGGRLQRNGEPKPENAAAAAMSPAERPPALANTLVYPADGRGHVIVDGVVNGAAVRFLVDTGATLVTLTPADARAAGVSPGPSAFNQRARTANGVVRMATMRLRELRLDQLSVGDVSAAVIENLDVSLLGMSFLSRLRSYEMRDGKLTITW